MSNRATGLGNMDCPCVLGRIANTPSPALVFQQSRKYKLARNAYLATRLLLLGDDLILDAGVDGGRNDILLHQLVLALVGPVLDDVRGADIADPFQGAQLRLGRGIDIEELRGGRFLRWLWLDGLGYWRRTGLVRNSGLNRLRETGLNKGGTHAEAKCKECLPGDSHGVSFLASPG